MLYLIGGAPRSGKTILAQQMSAKLGIGWISTDLLTDILRVKQVEGVVMEWNASPQAIANTAEWFFPCLERFVWGINSAAENYIIDGVSFLPEQVWQLSKQYSIRALFLGCSQMTLTRFDNFPGHSHGYAKLPKSVRQRFAQDVTQWSSFVQQEASRFNYPYIDMGYNFSTRLIEAEALLTQNSAS